MKIERTMQKKYYEKGRAQRMFICKVADWNNYPALRKLHHAYNQPDNGWYIDREMPILKGEDRKYVDDLIYVGE